MVQGIFSPAHYKKSSKMKKTYLAPETEEILVDFVQLLTSSPDSDTTDPVHIITDPTDGDLDEWGND